MKKIMVGCMIAILIFAIVPIESKALNNSENRKELVANSAQTQRTKELNARLYEIKAMDKSSMSASEKKALRKEVRSIKSEARSSNGGIYLSVGAIIIIVLLLIILL